MKFAYYFIISSLLLLFISCDSQPEEKLKIEKVEDSEKSLPKLNVKPLSTDKTHEGGVDTTTAVFK